MTSILILKHQTNPMPPSTIMSRSVITFIESATTNLKVLKYLSQCSSMAMIVKWKLTLVLEYQLSVKTHSVSFFFTLSYQVVKSGMQPLRRQWTKCQLAVNQLLTVLAEIKVFTKLDLGKHINN